MRSKVQILSPRLTCPAFLSFGGRPTGRSLLVSPVCLAILVLQRSSPNGAPRSILFRSRLRSFTSIDSFTILLQPRGRSTGQGDSGTFTLSLVSYPRLDQRHDSACFTIFARSGFASTYRQRIRKCSSLCTGKLLKRPW